MADGGSVFYEVGAEDAILGELEGLHEQCADAMEQQVAALELAASGWADVGARMSVQAQINKMKREIKELRQGLGVARKRTAKRLEEQGATELTVLAYSRAITNSAGASAVVTDKFAAPSRMAIQGFLVESATLVATGGSVILTSLVYGGKKNIINSPKGVANVGSTGATGASTLTNGLLIRAAAAQPTFIPFRAVIESSEDFQITYQNASAVAADSSQIALKFVASGVRAPIQFSQ